MNKKILLTNMQCLHWAILAVLVVVFISYYPCPALATTYYVNPGESIQDSIDAASYGDTVEVSAGMYVELITLKNGVALIGAGASTTTIAGDSLGSVVTSYDCDLNTVLDGFTITNGTAQNGGGMYSSSSSLMVTDCKFIGNSANIVGGGMYNNGGNVTVNNCTFSGNTAMAGAGMYNEYSNPMLTNCMFGGNWAYWGGGMLNCLESNPMVTNCTFYGNLASAFGGGGMFNDDSSPMVTNCTFRANPAHDFGGGMYNQAGSPTVTNCTFSGNSADIGGGIYNQNSSHPILTSCILWGDSANSGSEIFNEELSSATVSYSDIEGGWTGIGNIDADPLFADADGQLLPGSPCIDAGDNTTVPGSITADFDGNPRFMDDPATADTGNGTPPIVDMGVYEYQSSIICVDADAAGGGDGRSWATAYNHLQDALAAAAGGSTIWVAEGTYKPDPTGLAEPREATFQLASGVAIYGGFPSGGGVWDDRNPNAYETVLSGDLNGDDSGFNNNDENSYQVVTGSGTDASAVLDGFTITAGNANQTGPYAEYARGGGMYNEYGNPTVANCTFNGNWAYFGGGMCNDHGSPTVTDCTFSANRSEEGGGGGMCNYPGSSPTLTNCIFTGNSTDDSGGGMWNYTYSSPILTNCTFSANSAHSGGGINNYNYSSPTLNNCTFSGNSANYGGGMFNRYFSDPWMTNCNFRGNSAIEAGGAMYFWNSCILTLSNCSFSENSAPVGYNDFADAATTFGEIVTTGDQILYIMDETDPDGVRVTTDPSGGSTPAIVSFCGGTTNLTFGPDTDMVVNGCSIEIEVTSGMVEIEFVAADGTIATTSLNAGNSLIAEQEILAITVPLTNSEDVVVVVDGQVYILSPGETKTLVKIDIDPDTLNLKSKEKWISCYIELPEGLDVADIDVSTVELNGIQAQSHPTEIGDYDLDDVADLMVKFDKDAVQETVEVGDGVLIIVTGELSDGTVFEGHDTIRVFD